MLNSIFNQIDANQRKNFILEKVDGLQKLIRSEKVFRVIKIAIPFLNLYGPAQRVVNIELGLINCWKIGNDIVTSYNDNDEFKNILSKIIELNLVISVIATTILAPRVSILISEGVKITEKVTSLFIALYQLEGKKAAIDTFEIAYSAVFIASIIYASPEIIAISLIAQGIFELNKAYQEYQENHLLEAGANILLASIRFAQVKPHILAACDNYKKRVMAKEKERLGEIYKTKQEQLQEKLKEALYNIPSDQFAILPPENEWKVDQFEFNAIYWFAHKYDSWEYIRECSVIWLTHVNQTGMFFYVYLPSPINPSSLSYGIMDENLDPIKWDLMGILGQQGIQFDNTRQSTGSCVHNSLGEGIWKSSRWITPEGGSLFIPVYFGEKSNAETFFKKAENCLFDKNVFLKKE